MKKTLVMMLAVVMLIACCAPALAQKANLTKVKSSPNLFDVETIDDTVYITSALPMSNRSFVHKYESEQRYSGTEFMLMILNYGQSDEFSSYCLRIYYSTEQGYQNIDSVSFIIDDKEYLFTDVSQVIQECENGTYTELVVIYFDNDNLEFLLPLEDKVNAASDVEDSVEWLDAHPITMVLHGKEDIAVQLDGGFYLDFMAVKLAVVNTVDLFETLTYGGTGTTLTVKDAK